MPKSIVFSGNCPKCNNKIAYSSKNTKNACEFCKIDLVIDYGMYNVADGDYKYGYFLKELVIG